MATTALLAAPAIGAVQAQAATTVTMASSSSYVWTGERFTLTANTSSSITGGYIAIYDETYATPKLIKTCSSGSTCWIYQTEGLGSWYFRAYVARTAPSSSLPPSWTSRSSVVRVDANDNVSTTLTLSTPRNVPVGAPVTVTMSASRDITQSRFFFRIFDTTTGQQVTYCGYGKSCSTTVTMTNSGVKGYVGYLALLTPGQPAWSATNPKVQYVAWQSTSDWTVSLSENYSTGTAIATTNKNLTDAPYNVYFYDAFTCELLGTFGNGTTSSLVAPGRVVVAVVAYPYDNFPPTDVKAVSQVMYVDDPSAQIH